MSFVLLPDTGVDSRLVARAREVFGSDELTHPSGNPWLIGDLGHRVDIRDPHGDIHVAFLGDHRVPRAPLARALAAVRQQGLDADLRGVAPGRVHLAVRAGCQSRLQGTLSTSRQVCWGQLEGLPFASDSPGDLGSFLGTPIDTSALALRLASRVSPLLLHRHPVWAGVHTVDPGNWLLLGPREEPRQLRWWRPTHRVHDLDTAGGDLDTAGRALRAVLLDSLADATRGLTAVSADLSGGLDSTAVCYLLARLDIPLTAYHAPPDNPRNDDSRWAERAAADLGCAFVRLPSVGSMSSAFDVTTGYEESLVGEGPLAWSASLTHARTLRDAVAGPGAAVHLTGLGGDELFGILPAFPWSLFRQEGLRSLPLVRRFCQVNRWSLAAVGRGLFLGADPDNEHPRVPHTLREERGDGPAESFAYLPTPFLPPWVTPEAEERVLCLLREDAARGTRPLDPDRMRHQALVSLVFQGTVLRHLNTLTGPDLAWESPYLDARVVEVALGAPTRLRLARDTAKPLLARATSPDMPTAFSRRNGKGEYSRELHLELRRRRDPLLRYLDDSLLAERGLVDPGRLAAYVSGMSSAGGHLVRIAAVTAVERWLRAVSGDTPRRDQDPRKDQNPREDQDPRKDQDPREEQDPRRERGCTG